MVTNYFNAWLPVSDDWMVKLSAIFASDLKYLNNLLKDAHSKFKLFTQQRFIYE